MMMTSEIQMVLCYVVKPKVKDKNNYVCRAIILEITCCIIVFALFYLINRLNKLVWIFVERKIGDFFFLLLLNYLFLEILSRKHFNFQSDCVV